MDFLCIHYQAKTKAKDLSIINNQKSTIFMDRWSSIKNEKLTHPSERITTKENWRKLKKWWNKRLSFVWNDYYGWNAHDVPNPCRGDLMIAFE